MGARLSKRAYPKKSDEARRIVVSFSLSGDRLRWFREALALSNSHEPEVSDIREAAQSLAHQSVDAFIQQKIELDNPTIL